MTSSREGDGGRRRPGRSILARINEADERVFEAVAGWHSPLGDAVLPPLSVAASYSRLWMAVSAVIGLTGGRKERRAVAEALIAVACTSAVVNIVAKGAARRSRPTSPVPSTRALEQPSSSSFPSGHSASAAAYSGVIAERIPGLALPINVLAGAVAFSRVYTGVHYPGDVAVGWLIGRVIARVVTAVSGRLASH